MDPSTVTSAFLQSTEGRESASAIISEGLNAATAAASQSVTEGRERKGGGAATPPRKRALLFATFIACLSFLYIVVSLTANLISEIMKNDRVWESIATMRERSNFSTLVKDLNNTLLPFLQRRCEENFSLAAENRRLSE